MKQFVHKVVSIFMAFVVLFSTMSFTVDMHYCGDSLVDVAVFSKTKNCGMQMEDFSFCKIPIVKKDCCKEKQLIHQSEDTFQPNFRKITFSQQLFIVSYVYTYTNLFEGLQERVVPFKYYAPPLVVKDIQLLDEVFLI